MHATRSLDAEPGGRPRRVPVQRPTSSTRLHPSRWSQLLRAQPAKLHYSARREKALGATRGTIAEVARSAKGESGEQRRAQSSADSSRVVALSITRRRTVLLPTPLLAQSRGQEAPLPCGRGATGLDAHRGCSSPLPEKHEPSPEEHRHRGSNRRAQRRRSAAPLDPTYHGTRRQRSGASAGERARGFRATLLTHRLCVCRVSHARGGRRARAPGTSRRACSSSSKGSTAAPAPQPPPGLLGGRARGGQASTFLLGRRSAPPRAHPSGRGGPFWWPPLGPHGGVGTYSVVFAVAL